MYQEIFETQSGDLNKKESPAVAQQIEFDSSESLDSVCSMQISTNCRNDTTNKKRVRHKTSALVQYHL